ncbi:gluconate 2-dehydrogenase subunit 3 family protein [Halosegnis marinus]|uniref:Gluconate 2-dehydrogenase subunit 3 family protein n=1 Tax=Halosegnis marinus TaxID=3034023 RepID=A0ABD5ZLD4_9EURY|nr:gluconate 2-dehydrogenase subunit 3 family protein [Halosegnis sp. DT85]
MKLTRRDALAALSGAGIVAAGGAAALAREDIDAGDGDGEPSLDRVLATLVAAAETTYPSEVEGIPDFVEAYSLGRIEGREGYLAGVREAVGQLDETARAWEGAPFADLDGATRDDVLRSLGVHTAEEVPDGTIPERVRYYVVNEVLYALYASPTGGRLVGIENPQGYPGGTESYRRGPR